MSRIIENKKVTPRSSERQTKCIKCVLVKILKQHREKKKSLLGVAHSQILPDDPQRLQLKYS